MKLLGKVALLAACVLVIAATLIVLRLKDVPLAVLAVYGPLLVALAAGLLWPGAFGRRRVAVLLGVPAGLATLALYFAVVFYVTDTPVLLGLGAVTALVTALVTVRRTPAGPSRSRRVFLLGGAGVALGALGVASVGWARDRRRDRLAPAARARAAALHAPGRRQRVTDGAVRVFPLHLGDTVVTFGQFHGGLDDWVGVEGYVRTLLDKTQLTVPVYAYLIDHPRHGVLMVDAGITWEQAHDHDGYYNHNAMVSRLLSQRDEYRQAPEQDLRVRLGRLGYHPDDVATVFLTHVHDDHAGGLRHLPTATVVLDRRDWDQGVRYGYSFERVEANLRFPRYDSGAYGTFPDSQDYFGDGSVILLPTPGHSPGHQCVLLRMDDGSVLFMGDTLYTLRHLAVDEVRQLTLGGADTANQLDAARRVQDLLADPTVAPLFAHETTPYRSVVDEVFATGRPDPAGFAALRRHLDGVLTPDWRLR